MTTKVLYHIISSSKGENQSTDSAEKTLPRFCYRKGLDPKFGFPENSDRGWGCCYRCVQGVLANFFLRMIHDDPGLYRSIFPDTLPLDLFKDCISSPFSIYNLVSKANSVAKIRPGVWARPSQLVNVTKTIFGQFGISVFASEGSHIIPAEHKSIAFPSLILVPALFGMQNVDGMYVDFIKEILKLPASLGFVSGRNGSAYYFVGYNGNDFYYFDPHVTHSAIQERDPIVSFFDLPIKKLNQTEMKSSILFAFYAQSQNEIEEIINKLIKMPNSPFSETNVNSAMNLDLEFPEQ